MQVTAVSMEWPRQIPAKHSVAWRQPDRPKIGRKDDGSVLSIVVLFLMIGNRNASLKPMRKQPTVIDRLHRSVKRGDTCFDACQAPSIKTGGGSAADDLSGRRAVAIAAPASVVGVNSVNDASGRAERFEASTNRR
jgi:hypothetical protein